MRIILIWCVCIINFNQLLSNLLKYISYSKEAAYESLSTNTTIISVPDLKW